MLKRLWQLLGFLKVTPPKGIGHYQESLESLGKTNQIEDLYFELAEFWNRFDVNLVNQINSRELINKDISVNHTCMDVMIKTFGMINDLIKVEDWNEIHRVSGIIFKEPTNITLEYYFSTDKGFPLLVLDSIKQLQSVMRDHYELLLEIDNLNRLWALNLVYQDLLTLTRSIIFDMSGDFNGHN